MTKTIVRMLAMSTLSLSLGVGGCAAEPTTASPAAEAVDTAEHALSVVASRAHPALADGRAVAEWHTFMTREGSFRVRGVTEQGETVAEFVFRPELGAEGSPSSLVVESLAPERGALRVVNGEVTESFAVSAATQALYDAMGTDLEALEAVGEDAAGGIAPQGWWACTKASGKVTYHCGASAAKIIACLRKLDSASDLGKCVKNVGSACKSAAKNWVKECL